MPLAAWSVHQLRYFLTYGTGAGRELSVEGHAYLTVLMPVIAGLAALAFGDFLLRLACARRNGAHDQRPLFGTAPLWILTVTALLTVYVGQELLEGLVATGHPPGLAGVFGEGGWWAVPAAVLVGGLVALGLRGARAVETLLAGRRSHTGRRARPPRVRIPASAALSRLEPLARMGAGRAPPIAPEPV